MGARHALPAGLLILASLVFTACGQQTSSPPAAKKSPTPDAATQKYVALVHQYWIDYNVAQRDIPTFVKVCWGSKTLSMSVPPDPNAVEPQTCVEIASALLATHQTFLTNLDSTPAPTRFSADDQVFRTEIPKAIIAAKAMVSSARAGKKQAVVDAMTNYIEAIYPQVTDALDDVDPYTAH
jgi:hypothetical protein